MEFDPRIFNGLPIDIKCSIVLEAGKFILQYKTAGGDNVTMYEINSTFIVVLTNTVIVKDVHTLPYELLDGPLSLIDISNVFQN
jgi:hypothetical protein